MTADALTLAFGSFLPGGMEWVVLLVLGLLIFGRRLPEVGKSLGQGIVQFKKGIKGIEDEIEDASSQSDRSLPDQTASRSSLPSESATPASGQTPDDPHVAVGGEANPYAADDQRKGDAG